MVRTKDKKPKGDDAFKKVKQKIGKKKLAPATATRAEVHARTLRIVKPREEVITPETINRKRDANDFLTTKAEASQRVSAQAGGAGWEKHRPDRSLHENLMGAAHYREATRASAFTALNTTVDHFASSISPSQFMQVLNVTLGAVTDTGMDVREKALALFMKLLKLFPPPMTSDGVRHIMTYIRIALTHAQPGVRRSGIKMLGAFTKQWPGAVRRAYASGDNTKIGASAAAEVTQTSAVTDAVLSDAVSASTFVVVGGDCGTNNTSAFLRSSEQLAHVGGVLNGTAGGGGAGTPNTYIADSNNGGNGVEVAGIYDTTVRAKTFDIEQIIEWASEVAVAAPVSQHHRMMPVIATLLEECLPYRDHTIATGDALLSSLSSDAKADSTSDTTSTSTAVVTLPVAYVERYFKKFASKWSMMWKEMMELGYKMFRDAIVVERITAVGRCFAACTIYLHRHGRLFTNHYSSGNAASKAKHGGVSAQLNQPFDPRWMLRELFLHKVPFTMKELTTGSSRMQNSDVSVDAVASSRMTTQDALLRGPIMAPKAAAAVAASAPSRSKAAKKLADKGHQHLTVVAKEAPKGSQGNRDASQLTVFDALAAVANVSASRLRIAEVVAWCLLPIASDKQEQVKCNAIIAGQMGIDTDSSSTKRDRTSDKSDSRKGAKKKQSRSEGTTQSATEEGEEEEIDEVALGKPDLEVDEKGSDEEVDLDENNANAEGGAQSSKKRVPEAGSNKGNDNVAQAKRIVRSFIESPACPLSSAVQILRALLALYPHLYPTVGVSLIGALLGRVQPLLAATTPIAIASKEAKNTSASSPTTTKKNTAEDNDNASTNSDSSDDDEDDEENSSDDKMDKERNASAAHGSQCGRDLKELMDLVSAAMGNRYVLSWPQRVAGGSAMPNSTVSGVTKQQPLQQRLPIEHLGVLLREQVPKTLFCLRNFSAAPNSLPAAHSASYNNAARRQIAMAHDRVATLGSVLRCAVHAYHDAVTMRHPALYPNTRHGESQLEDAPSADIALRKALSALLEMRMKRPDGGDDLVMQGPLARLADPVLEGIARGTLSYLK